MNRCIVADVSARLGPGVDVGSSRLVGRGAEVDYVRKSGCQRHMRESASRSGHWLRQGAGVFLIGTLTPSSRRASLGRGGRASGDDCAPAQKALVGRLEHGHESDRTPSS